MKNFKIIGYGIVLIGGLAISNAQVALDQTIGNLYKTIAFANGTNTNHSNDSYTIVGPNNRNSATSSVKGSIAGAFAPGSTTPISFTSTTDVISTKGPEYVGNTTINFGSTTVYEDIMTIEDNAYGIYCQFKRKWALADTNSDGQYDAHYTERELVQNDTTTGSTIATNIPVGTIFAFNTPTIASAIGGGTLLAGQVQLKVRNGTELVDTTTVPGVGTAPGIVAWTNPTMGVEDISSEMKVTLYPNPAQSFFKIVDGLSVGYTYAIKVLTMNGVQVKNIEGYQIGESFDVSMLPMGVYMVVVTNPVANHQFIQKLIKN